MAAGAEMLCLPVSVTSVLFCTITYDSEMSEISIAEHDALTSIY